jgi:hypothetical protein
MFTRIVDPHIFEIVRTISPSKNKYILCVKERKGTQEKKRKKEQDTLFPTAVAV